MITKELLSDKSFYLDSYTIHSYHADFTCRLSVPSLFYFLQESAWHHAEVNAFGFDDLVKQDSLWALARMKTSINRLPEWGSKVDVLTWSRGAEGIYAYRDFELFGKSGERLAAAASQWLILDANTRRPRRTEEFKEHFPSNPHRRVFDHPFPREQAPTFTTPDSWFVIRLSDMDMNGHVNNVSYIRWAMDAFDIDFMKTHRLTDADVFFLAESKAGDTAGVSIIRLTDSEYHAALIRQSDGKPLARMHLTFGK